MTHLAPSHPSRASAEHPTTRLTLYHTPACHLCEEAEALAMAGLAANGMAADSLTLIDIAEDGELLERYGLLIPVLRSEASGQELRWPFALPDIQRLLKPLKNSV